MVLRLNFLVDVLAVCWVSSHFLEARAQNATIPPERPAIINDFNEIAPSPNVSWTPCYGNFTCTRLQVPLDYDNPAGATAEVAFIKIAAATQPAPNILINPGGPGGSGVGIVLSLAPTLVSLLGTSVNIVGFDPRGVNNTTPTIDCFPGAPTTRDIFQQLFKRELPDASSTSLASQFVAADAYGRWCSNVLGGTGPNGTARYVGTLTVARDMLSYTEAEQRALALPESESKLWYYGFSYGTVLGATFASTFPDRIGRMVLDGVVDGEDYYNLRWFNNLADADKIVQRFFDDCFKAGPERCPFWGPSAKDIQTRFDKILTSLKELPIPVWDASDMPHIATYADLKHVLLNALYYPLSLFPVLAQVMHDLEVGNGTSLIDAAGINFAPNPNPSAWTPGDAGNIIPCVDGFGKYNISTVGTFQKHVESLVRESRYVGDAWAYIPLQCRSMDVPPPPSARFSGSLPPSAANTSFPLLFVSNVLDPVTPLRNAHKMASGFPRSVVLAQDGLGHPTLSNPSKCTIQYVQAYFNNGTMPPSNVTCEVDTTPFFGNDSPLGLQRR